MNPATQPVETIVTARCKEHGLRAIIEHVADSVKPIHVRCGDCKKYCAIDVTPAQPKT